MATSDKSSEVPNWWLGGNLLGSDPTGTAQGSSGEGFPTSQEYVRNMAELRYGRKYTEEQLIQTAHSLGFEVRRRVPPYIETLKEHGRLDLLVPPTEEEILKNDALELLEDEEDAGTISEEMEEKGVQRMIKCAMKRYKEKNNTKKFFHLMYNQEIKIDVEEKLYNELDFSVLFECRCITKKGQVHYHAMIEQMKDIHTKDSLLYHFKKARSINKWPVKSYQITHMKSDHHFVNACMYMCMIKAGRDHGPHSERLLKITPAGSERIWNKIAETYENLYKEKHEANQAYHLRMKKSKIYVDNV